MKKSNLFAAWLCLAAIAALMCAGCAEEAGEETDGGDPGNGSENLNTFLGMVNGKLPAIPSNVWITNTSAHGVTLRWSMVSKADEYYVYRDVFRELREGYYSCGMENWDYSSIYRVGSTSSTSYSDTGLLSGAEYCYAVAAVNKYGETRRSKVSRVTTAMPEPPKTPPRDVAANAKSPDSVVVSWSRVSEAAKYEVYRSTTAQGSYYVLGDTRLLSYTDVEVSPATTYYYKVRAVNEAGRSDLSNYAVCTTPKN